MKCFLVATVMLINMPLQAVKPITSHLAYILYTKQSSKSIVFIKTPKYFLYFRDLFGNMSKTTQYFVLGFLSITIFSNPSAFPPPYFFNIHYSLKISLRVLLRKTHLPLGKGGRCRYTTRSLCGRFVNRPYRLCCKSLIFNFPLSIFH